ncbi:MFS transporter [Cognatishimia activa]|uniref:MFS transporter n=1 Tax=Cognatishimia activa TaxID=1715691 RepID=UPI002231E6B7|nr:MFS transporter [Cognatishimia activa]UZD92435.1 MFS transporter [Cognatishimia activa]
MTNRSALPFLLLLFTNTLCNSMIVPYMGFFIVEGLGKPPWIMSVYALIGISLTIVMNRQIGKRLDAGHRVFPLVGVAAAGFALATLSLALFPIFPVVMTLGVLGFAISSSAVSTMFTFGRAFASERGFDATRFNSFMRATTSTGWMIGPAVSFMVADQIDETAVFKVAFALVVVWVGLWLRIVPRDMNALGKDNLGEDHQTGRNFGLWLAICVCFSLSLAHSMTFQALPLFFVQEVGLPTYAPGTHFSIKTFVEIFAILSTPWLIQKFGMRNTLMATVALGAITIQLLAAVTTFPQMILGAALEGLYYGLYANLSISFVQSFAGGRVGHATAMYWNAIMGTGILAGPLVGGIAQLHSFHLAVQVASIWAVVSLIVLLLSRGRGPSEVQSTT